VDSRPFLPLLYLQQFFINDGEHIRIRSLHLDVGIAPRSSLIVPYRGPDSLAGRLRKQKDRLPAATLANLDVVLISEGSFIT
jgi:hypothetical protein